MELVPFNVGHCLQCGIDCKAYAALGLISAVNLRKRNNWKFERNCRYFSTSQSIYFVIYEYIYMLYTVYDLVNQSICFRWKQFCLSFRKDSVICIRILYFLLATIHVLSSSLRASLYSIYWRKRDFNIRAWLCSLMNWLCVLG